MSVITWREEFYPVRAADTLQEDAIWFSLRKWYGLRRENLDRHGMSPNLERLVPEIREHDNEFRSFPIAASTCALCEWYYDYDAAAVIHEAEDSGDDPNESDLSPCTECPLYKVRWAPCDGVDRVSREADAQVKRSPYNAWVFNSDPEPMIRLLQEALAVEILSGIRIEIENENRRQMRG